MGSEVHEETFAPVMLGLAAVLLAAVIGRGAAIRLKQPSVLGELLIGVAVGNIGYQLGMPLFIMIMNFGDMGQILQGAWNAGMSVPAALLESSNEDLQGLHSVFSGAQAFTLINIGASLWIFSNLGVLFLLFLVGLESSPKEMAQVGVPSAAVALIGVVAPFSLGYGTAMWFLPDVGSAVYAFIGAALCATSVGITARLFTDMDRIDTPESKVILGAAVIDDVLGLVVLAVVIGFVETGHLDFGQIGNTLAMAIGFLAIVMILGQRLAAWIIPAFDVFDRGHVRLIYPLCLCFFIAWLATLTGLAAIIGAFAAGLILSERAFPKRIKDEQSLSDSLRPLETVFAPIFFVLIGMQVNLESFANLEVLGLALSLTAIGVIGKLVAGLAAGKLDRIIVGLGMVPRGEVGLIFSSVGKTLGVFDETVFSAVVMTVILTTFIAPLALRMRLKDA